MMMMGLRFTSGLVTTEFSGKEQSGEKTWIVARVCDSSAAATEGQGHVNMMLNVDVDATTACITLRSNYIPCITCPLH